MIALIWLPYTVGNINRQKVIFLQNEYFIVDYIIIQYYSGDHKGLGFLPKNISHDIIILFDSITA